MHMSGYTRGSYYPESRMLYQTHSILWDLQRARTIWRSWCWIGRRDCEDGSRGKTYWRIGAQSAFWCRISTAPLDAAEGLVYVWRSEEMIRIASVDRGRGRVSITVGSP